MYAPVQMLSYIVGLIAAFVFLVNPISQLLFGSQHATGPSPRPHLNESMLAIDHPNDPIPQCPPDTYRAQILRVSPLVVYLENFLNEDERKHLLDISEPLFAPSTITHDSQTTQRDLALRDSEVALLPRDDAVRCIERRARAFQGWRRDVWIERVRTQRYHAPHGHYSHHFDFSRNQDGWGRVSTFMAWVDGSQDIEGGGTEFPYLAGRINTTSPEDGARWCKFIECDDESAEEKSSEEGGPDEPKGTVFKVAPGNAVYWENFSPEGLGYDTTWHAGLPVKKGVKVGLNIWSFGRIE